MTKKILITGITGMTGSHLADFLLAKVPDAHVFGSKRWRSSLANIAHLQNNPRLELVDCELTDSTSCLALISHIMPDYIFHLAGRSFVPDSWINPNATIMDNIQMQLNLFEAIRHAHCDPITQVALSSEEYGNVLPSELPISENNPLRPISPYGVSKVSQDMLAYQYFSSYGLKVIRTRAFNHEGPRRGSVFVTSNFAKQIAEIEAGLLPPILKVGSLTPKRDWTDVRDMVRAYWLAANHCNPGEVYVLASGITRSIQEMLDFLLSLTKEKITVEVDSSRIRPSDVELLLGDSSKFKKATGWQPEFSFEQMMEDILNYWRGQVREVKNRMANIT